MCRNANCCTSKLTSSPRTNGAAPKQYFSDTIGRVLFDGAVSLGMLGAQPRQLVWGKQAFCEPRRQRRAHTIALVNQLTVEQPFRCVADERGLRDMPHRHAREPRMCREGDSLRTRDILEISGHLDLRSICLDHADEGLRSLTEPNRVRGVMTVEEERQRALDHWRG